MSRRHTDPARSAPRQRYHTHDRIEPAQPGRIYRADIELWPTSPRPRLPTGARFRARPARFSHRHAHKTVIPTPIAPINRSCASTMVSQQIVITTHKAVACALTLISASYRVSSRLLAGFALTSMRLGGWLPEL
jgi:hypothetical protein